MSQIQRTGSDLLRSLRKLRSQTQEQLASEAGVSAAYLSEIERSRKRPTREVVQKLAAALELSKTDEGALIEAFYPKGPAVEPATKDRLDQERHASHVWIVAAHPAEATDMEYRRSVEHNIQRGVRYTYWLENPSRFDKLSELMNPDIRSSFLELAECISTPSEANWFSFVIYNPMEPHKTHARYALSELPGRVTHTAPVDTVTLHRILLDLTSIYHYLQANRGAIYSGYGWHFPRSDNGEKQ